MSCNKTVAPLRIDPKPWLFAAKTTGACLLALFIAFRFNLDQPQWTLLTIFIVAQPGTSGGILGKSFSRLIGTFIGAAVALILVGLFAQERVLFLGALAIWIGICTFGSQLVRSWTNYAFVLSGYTAAIIGIPATLNPDNTFYLATARLTEICLGIMVGTAVNQLIMPARMTDSLKRALADTRRTVSGFAAGVLNDGDVTGERAGVVSAVMRIEDLLNSAVFEDVPTRLASNQIRGLAGALVDVLAAAQPLQRQLRAPSNGRQPAGCFVPWQTRTEAAEAIMSWESGGLDAVALTERLRALRFAEPVTEASNGELLELDASAVLAGRFATFVESFAACARAWEAAANRRPGPPSLFALDPADDRFSATLTGVRSALAVIAAGLFWILTAWPRGYMAVLLTALGTSRASTMGNVVPLAIATTMTFGLSFIPSFILCEMLLPGVSGYPMFALFVGPMLFLFALLMTNKRTFVIGYMAAMLFLNVSGFQNRMTYDPIAFINITLAGIFASSVSGLLWAMIAPDTRYKQRLRFARTARKGTRLLFDTRAGTSRLIGFEGLVGGAVIRLARALRPGRPEDEACMQAALVLLGTGRELALRTQAACLSSDMKSLSVPYGNAQLGLPAPLSCDLLESARSAMNDCVRVLSRESLDTSTLLRAAQDLEDVMDEFAQQDSPAVSETRVTCDAC